MPSARRVANRSAKPIAYLYATAPDLKTAERIAGALIDERLAACVNVLPMLVSVYRWKGAVERAKEVAMIVKTRATLAGAAADRLRRLHPYEIAAVAAFGAPTTAADSAFADWVYAETAPPRGKARQAPVTRR